MFGEGATMKSNISSYESTGTTVTDSKSTVREYLKGLAVYNQSIKIADYGDVVLREDYKEIKNVRIISGGCSGNEPAYAGFVGKGMLTAAVHGNRFTSPMPKDILRTIRELSLNHTSGVLMIVHGNSGNLLSFGLAIERALRERLRVKLLPVTDDYNNMTVSKTRKRGLSGIMLIIKIAGAMAEQGCSLDEIFTYCSEVEKRTRSIAVGFKNFSQFLDQCCCKRRINDNEIAVGIGLNEEPPVKKVKISSSQEIVKIIIQEFRLIKEVLQTDSQLSFVVLVNNIGGLSKLEEFTFVNELMEKLLERGHKINRIYVGSFLTSPSLTGIIVTIMRVSDSNILEYLDAPCNVSAWMNVNQFSNISTDNEISGRLKKKTCEYKSQPNGPKLGNANVNILRVSLQFICDAVMSCEKQLNIIDFEHGDGDTGTRLRKVCTLIVEKLTTKELLLDYPAALFDHLSFLIETNIGGTLSCIYSILFQSVSNYFSDLPENEIITHKTWLNALIVANYSLKRYGNVELGNLTMYDPLEICARTVRDNLESSEHFLDAFSMGVTAAEETARKTKLSGSSHPDSGAHAVGIWMRACIEGVKLSCPY